MTDTFDDLLCIPFEWGGRTPEGMDCYGLAIEAGRRLGVDVPDFWSRIAEAWDPGSSTPAQFIELVPEGWEAIREPYPTGTIVLLYRNGTSDSVAHLATVIEPGMLLHTQIDGHSRKVELARVRSRVHSAWRPTQC